MRTVIRATPLYGFLRSCNLSPLEKIVLDCGAGGNCPPLTIFHEQGYKVYGVEISDSQLNMANKFCEDNGIDLNIMKGDMRKLNFKSETMSFVYSFNSIFHLTKADTFVALQEMERVLKNQGLCFVNFLSVNDCGFGEGEEIGEGEFIQIEENEKVVHSYYKDDEPDKYFKNYEFLRKEKRKVDFYQNGNKHELSYIDYTLRKK